VTAIFCRRVLLEFSLIRLRKLGGTLNHQEARILILSSVMIGIGPAYAAQSPDQPSADTSPPATTAPAAAPATPAPPATAAPVTAAAPTSPSVEVLRKARLAGYHIRKLREGTTVFCKNEAHVGSRFSAESCIDEPQLQETLIRAEDQRDKLTNRRETGTNNK
jgi:hypothetical protein